MFIALWSLVGCNSIANSVSNSVAAPYIGADGQVLTTIDGNRVFIESPLPLVPPQTDTTALLSVATDTLRYLDHAQGDPAITSGILSDVGTTLADIRATLALVQQLALNSPEQLKDPEFLSRCFRSLRWIPDGGRTHLRQTRYLVYSVNGSPILTESQQFALYAPPADEQGLTEAEAEAKKDSLMRYRYTRQQVAGGVYREGGASAGQAEPLVWLSHEDHEQAILQGTVAARLPGQVEPLLFNVYRSNGMPYDRSIHDTQQQRRYWYFRQVDRVRGWGKEPVTGIALAPMAAVAGDIYNLGLGRVIALKNADGLRLVVLADTGGAFQPNLHQLDLYTGIFDSYAAFSEATRKVGEEADAFILIARPECRP